jgi:hypothetical protein
MRTLFFLLLLSACSTLNAPERKHHPSAPEDRRTETAESDVDKSSSKPPKKTARPTLPAPSEPQAPKNPPCEIDAENKRAAFLQKLDCLKERVEKDKANTP